MLLRLTATSFLYELTSGRSRPCVFECEDDAGKSAGEFVVKLPSRMDAGHRGSLHELIAALLIRHIGLTAPDPAIVTIEPELAEGIVQRNVRGDIEKSAGENFGTRFLKGGYAAFQPNQRIGSRLSQSAFETFGFDAFIDNPDRRAENPNLLFDGEQFWLIDHEAAFSFVFAVLKGAEPWTLHDMPYLRDHVFFRELRGVIIDAFRIQRQIAALTPGLMDSIVAEIPESWKHESLIQISERLLRIAEHAAEFVEAIKLKLQ